MDKNILLIDGTVNENNVFVSSCNESTLPLVYSPTSTTREEVLQFFRQSISNGSGSVRRVALAFHYSPNYLFLQGQSMFDADNVSFLNALVTEFGITHFDFLACNTLNDPRWMDFYNTLGTTSGAIIGASDNNTGNLKYGGDWMMENTKENVQTIYFNDEIAHYDKLLGFNFDFSYLVTTDNSIYNVGNNGSGQLGYSVGIGTILFQQLINSTGKNPISICGGDGFAIALMTDGSVYGTGYNYDGELGTGNTASVSTLTAMTIPNGKIPCQISCGVYYTMILMTDGSIYGTGDNWYGQLGTGNTTSVSTLTAMINDTGKIPSSISCGTFHTTVLMTDGSVYGTGYNYDGELGTGNNNGVITLTAMINDTGKTPSSASCGAYHTTVLMTDGSVYVTGFNFAGQLGIGVNNYNNVSTLTAMINNTGKTPSSVSCGAYHTTVLMTDGSVYGTGFNAYGQLGTGNTTDVISTLTVMINNTGKTPNRISCGVFNTMVLMTDNTVYGTGFNAYGQLGIGTHSDAYSLTQSKNMSGAAMTEVAFLINQIPISNICFLAGMLIKTNQGYISIEKINPDIHTINGKKIVGITKTIYDTDKHLVCFEKDSIENNIPSQKTVMTQNHKILYNGKMIDANNFLDKFENVKKIKYNNEILYNVLMEEYDTMLVNNLICETLNPHHSMAWLYEKLSMMNMENQQQLIKTYNDEYKKINNCQ